MSGVKEIKSASEENNARIRAEFSTNVPLDVAANDVREAVAGVERRLPEGVEDINVVKADADATPVIRLALVSQRLPQETLTRLAEEDVKTELSAIPGVATVLLFGDREPVLRVVVKPMRLASYGLSIDDVAKALRSASMDVPVGSFQVRRPAAPRPGGRHGSPAGRDRGTGVAAQCPSRRRRAGVLRSGRGREL